MTLTQWTPDLSVGDRVLDAQHEELFRALNRIGVALAKGADGATVLRLLGYVVDYLRDHFEVETQMMIALGDPGSLRHQAAHQRLLERLGLFQAPGGPRLTAQVLIFIRAWMVDHFQKEDRPLVQQAKRIQWVG